MSELYKHRKETIERIFGTAKEAHGFRYTQMHGKSRMEMKVGMTFACINLKKLAKMKFKKGKNRDLILLFFAKIEENLKKMILKRKIALALAC